MRLPNSPIKMKKQFKLKRKGVAQRKTLEELTKD